MQKCGNPPKWIAALIAARLPNVQLRANVLKGFGAHV